MQNNSKGMCKNSLRNPFHTLENYRLSRISEANEEKFTDAILRERVH